MAEDVWKGVVDEKNRAKSSLRLQEGATTCTIRWPVWETSHFSDCLGEGGDGGVASIGCIASASQIRIRPEWGTLSFHRRILFLNVRRDPILLTVLDTSFCILLFLQAIWPGLRSSYSMESMIKCETTCTCSDTFRVGTTCFDWKVLICCLIFISTRPVQKLHVTDCFH